MAEAAQASESMPTEVGRGALSVLVAVSLEAGQVQQWLVCLPPGATLGDALALCQLPALGDGLHYGVWGRSQPLDYVLRAGDRVEGCRDLRIDPKLARRERFAKQGARRAGLFAKRRPGAKPGY